MPGALRPRALSPIQQQLVQPGHTTRRAINLPPPLPPLDDKGKGPAGGKPYKKKGTSSSSNEVTGDEAVDSGKPVSPKMPSLSPIGPPPAQFPPRRSLPSIQAQPSLSFTSPGVPRPKLTLPSMPSRRTSVDPFSTFNASADSSIGLEPIRARGLPAPLAFQRPAGQPAFSRPATLPAIAPAVKAKPKPEESSKQEGRKPEEGSKKEEGSKPEGSAKQEGGRKPEDTSKPDNPA